MISTAAQYTTNQKEVRDSLVSSFSRKQRAPDKEGQLKLTAPKQEKMIICSKKILSNEGGSGLITCSELTPTFLSLSGANVSFGFQLVLIERRITKTSWRVDYNIGSLPTLNDSPNLCKIQCNKTQKLKRIVR